MQLSAQRLRELLNYDPETGAFRWRVATSRRIRVRQIAGCAKTPEGYRLIRVDGRLYKAHRLAWLYVTGRWPADQIDHINGIRDDNRFANLREASNSENHQNQRRARSNNTTGLLGVSRDRWKFKTAIKLGGNQHYIGTFETAEAAHAAYVEAKRRLHPAGTL